jgi:hypothetical protein
MRPSYCSSYSRSSQQASRVLPLLQLLLHVLPRCALRVVGCGCLLPAAGCGECWLERWLLLVILLLLSSVTAGRLRLTLRLRHCGCNWDACTAGTAQVGHGCDLDMCGEQK